MSGTPGSVAGIGLAAVVAVLAALSACDRADRPGPGPGGETRRVVVGVRGDVSSFNIYTATNAFTQEVVDLLFPTLADESDDFASGPPRFLPRLARSWRFSDDRLRLTFELDPGARWSDGTPITSADVLFSHRASTDPDVGWVGRDVKQAIRGVEAPDRTTVVYLFERAYPYALMDAVEGNVVPRHVWGEVALDRWPVTPFLEAPVAGGPFRLARYEPGSLIELVRNPRWYGAPAPRLDGVVFRVIPDATAQVNELLTGGIDVLVDVPVDQARHIESAGRHRIVSVPDLSYGFVCWNTAREPFDDPRVRRALTMGIDRAELVEGLLGGSGRVASGPIPSLLWAHDPELRPLPHAPAEARRLLAEAGFSDSDGDGWLDRDGRPFRFELEANQESQLRGRIVETVASQLAELDIEAVPRRYEFGTFVDRHARHDFDAFVGSWRESTKVDLWSIFHERAIDDGYNYGAYVDDELNDVIERARTAPDLDTARPLWERAQRIVARDQPYTFLFERERLHAVDPRLEGFAPSPRTALAGLERWNWAGDARSP